MTLDRRAVLRAGVAASALGATGGIFAAPDAAADSTGEHVETLCLDGELLFDDPAREAASVDFGHIVHRLPRGVLKPGSTDDVVKVVRWAGEAGWKVTAQGESHSVYGRSQADGGIVIDMTSRKTIHGVRSDRIVVDPGIKWSEVLKATLPKGLTPPVLTDYLELSVGGTLTVGGVGGSSWRDGMQSDNVLELQMVTGNGQKYTCSPTRNRELFNAVRAGLGQVGMITRATLKLVPAPASGRRCTLTYPSLAGLLADQRLLLADGRFDYLQGAILPTPSGWKYTLDAAKLFSGAEPDDRALLDGLSDDRSQAQLTTLTYFNFLNRLAGLEALLRSNGQWFYPHPWLTTFVGDSRVEPTVTAELAALTPADLGTFGRVGVAPVRRAAMTSPLLRLPDEAVSFGFFLVRFPTTDDAALAQAMVRGNRAVYERVRAAGGTLYPVSAFPMSGEDWRAHFGAAWSQFRSTKLRYDPQNVLTPGYELF